MSANSVSRDIYVFVDFSYDEMPVLVDKDGIAIGEISWNI